jgi:hypothetical protein
LRLLATSGPGTAEYGGQNGRVDLKRQAIDPPCRARKSAARVKEPSAAHLRR